MYPNNFIAISRWTGPKRTRTYPLAKVYDTYTHSSKIVTVIPVFKDEGKGERRHDTNLDRITYTTFSWMNLMNVYIILAWYDNASKKDDYRITHQRFDPSYVREKIEEIAQYRMDAHHWNREHFQRDFVLAYQKAVESYSRIARTLGVSLHEEGLHQAYLREVVSESDSHTLDLNKFALKSLSASERAAWREGKTSHALEYSEDKTYKGLLELRNYLGGIYYLTADEVIFEGPNKLILQESKNTTKKLLPSLNDIKDALFRLILYAHIVHLEYERQIYSCRARLRLTGVFRGRYILPVSDITALYRAFPPRYHQLLNWLNTEIQLLRIECILEGHDGQDAASLSGR